MPYTIGGYNAQKWCNYFLSSIAKGSSQVLCASLINQFQCGATTLRWILQLGGQACNGALEKLEIHKLKQLISQTMPFHCTVVMKLVLKIKILWPLLKPQMVFAKNFFQNHLLGFAVYS